MKNFIITLSFALAFVATGLCDTKSLINLKRCPSYEPMPNVDLEKYSGQWFLFADNAVSFNFSRNCQRVFYSKEDATNFKYEYLWTEKDGSKGSSIVNRRIDPSRPGLFIDDNNFVQVMTLQGREKQTVKSESALLYTDYENVQLRYTCVNVDHFLFGTTQVNYYISVRNPKFDSFHKLLPLFTKLANLGVDMNQIVFANLDSC